MSNIEVELPDRVESDITRLVDQGEFLNREQAIEELLTLGMSSYDQSESTDEDEWGMQATSDQQDPALQNDLDDDGPMF